MPQSFLHCKYNFDKLCYETFHIGDIEKSPVRQESAAQ